MSSLASPRTGPGRAWIPGLGGRLSAAAILTVGVGFVAEALLSPVIDAHVGYHAVNLVLNGALLVASVSLARFGSTRVGRAGVIGAWGTAVMALLAAAGGVVTVLVEGLVSGETPGAVEGVTHTAVLVSLLFLVPLGLGLRRLDQGVGLVVALSSACLVALVLIGFDQPEVFLVPEGALGAGWLMLAVRQTGRSRAIGDTHD